MYSKQIQPSAVDAKFYIHTKQVKAKKCCSGSVSFQMNLADTQIKQLNILKTHERG